MGNSLTIEEFEKRQAQKVLSPKSLTERTCEFIERLTAGNFYGSIELTKEAGKVV